MKLPPAEFFDIFGLGTFTFLAILAFWALKTGKPVPRWALWILLLISLAGLLVDGAIVYLNYL